MSSRPAGPQELARQLLAEGGRDAGASPVSRYRTARAVVLVLSRSIGSSALEVLMDRAVALTTAQHSLMPDLQRLLQHDAAGQEVAALAKIHGEPAVDAAIEALLTALFELLSRLIGYDMSVRILGAQPPSPPDARADKERE